MKRLSIFLLCLTCISCEKTSPDISVITKKIQLVMNKQVEHWNHGDIEKYMLGYYRSDSLRFASGGTITYGWQSTLERYLKRYPNTSSMGKLRFSIIDIEVISAEAALVFGRWQLNLQSNDHPWGLFTLLFRKFPEGWLIVSDHTSSGRSVE